MRGKARGLIRGGFLFALVLAGCTGRPPGAEFVRRTEWIGKGAWLEADLHMHSRFSDGRHEPALLVQKAREHGCGAIAVTDHSDRDLEGASDGYFAAMAAARRENPDLVILDGIEWNAPPGAGDDHVNVLVPPAPDGVRVLKEIKARFDDLGRDSHDEKLAHEALQWLDDQSAAWAVPPAVIFNHPSRKAARSLDQLDKLRRFREVTPHLIGIEGAPGHQGATPLGSYPGPEVVVDRWDPAAARIGDVWDRLLAAGEVAASATAVLQESFRVPPGGVVLRARGRRQVAGGPALCFYTNPIRVIASGG